jgi:hypothetical protein
MEKVYVPTKKDFEVALKILEVVRQFKASLANAGYDIISHTDKFFEVMQYVGKSADLEKITSSLHAVVLLRVRILA